MSRGHDNLDESRNGREGFTIVKRVDRRPLSKKKPRRSFAAAYSLKLDHLDRALAVASTRYLANLATSIVRSLREHTLPLDVIARRLRPARR
jgi:hypothetical protein